MKDFLQRGAISHMWFAHVNACRMNGKTIAEAYESFLSHYGLGEGCGSFQSFKRDYYRIAQDFLEWRKDENETQQI